jgi:uracil-DNA glycosylase family protein
MTQTNNATLAEARTLARACTRCDLYKLGTQTVFGEGPDNATMVLVGEQPGDSEDRAGQPFVGPAGQLLNQALQSADIERSTVYVTNAVKHFKWVPKGKRRIHQAPDKYEVQTCRIWLETELTSIHPRLVIAMGATAARSLLERPVRVLSERGQIITGRLQIPVGITIHPSAILRTHDEEREAAMSAFVRDLENFNKALTAL